MKFHPLWIFININIVLKGLMRWHNNKRKIQTSNTLDQYNFDVDSWAKDLVFDKKNFSLKFWRWNKKRKDFFFFYTLHDTQDIIFKPRQLQQLLIPKKTKIKWMKQNIMKYILSKTLENKLTVRTYVIRELTYNVVG